MTDKALIDLMLQSYKGSTPSTKDKPKAEQISKKAVLGRFHYSDLYTVLSTLTADDVESCKYTTKPRQVKGLNEKEIAYCFKLLLAKYQTNEDQTKFQTIFTQFLDTDKNHEQQRTFIRKYKKELPKDLQSRATLKKDETKTMSESETKFSPAGLLILLVEHANAHYKQINGVEPFSALLTEQKKKD